MFIDIAIRNLKLRVESIRYEDVTTFVYKTLQRIYYTNWLNRDVNILLITCNRRADDKEVRKGIY